MKTYKTTIKDVEWVFRLMDKKPYIELHGSESLAITNPDKMEVDFRSDGINGQVVGHELFHVYSVSCGTHSTNGITKEDMEEIAAEIVGFHLEQMVAKKRAILKALTSLGKK